MSSDPSSALDSLKRRYDDLVEAVGLERVSREISDLSTTISKLPNEIEKIRSRGYAYRSYLENKADVLARNWDELRRRAERGIETASQELRGELDEVEQRVKQAEKVASSPERLEKVLPLLESAVDDLENKIDAAQGRVRSTYETLQRDVSQTESQLHQINWICDRKDEASFDFLANEAVFLVAEAEWVDERDNPNGFLFLTDQRMVFEQKEKVGKTLGLFGGSDVHEVKWELPLHQVEAIEPEDKGLFGGKDMVHLTLGSGAPYPKMTVEVKGGVDSKFWAKQIDRMISGDADDERAIEPDPEMIERLRNAPTECHVCGATLPMLVAGQSQVKCEYCGTVIRM